MKLSEILNDLTYGELSQIFLGGTENGSIDEYKHRQVLIHINQGLTDLHTRFNLNEGLVNVPLVAGTLSYTLQRPDLLKIERVYTDSGFEMGLNTGNDPYSCTTPNLHTLKVPAAVVAKFRDLPDGLKTDSLNVMYRAGHEPIETDQWGLVDTSKIEVSLPQSHKKALLLYVASQAHTPQGASGGFHMGSDYLAKYERECQRLENAGLQVDKPIETTRFQRGGWA